MSEDKPLEELAPIGDTKVAPAVGIAAIALNLALKYYGINTVQDGALYQQYKLEGRNMITLHLDHVFETAIRMEQHLMASEKRIQDMLVAAIEVAIAENDGEPNETLETMERI